MKRFVLSSLKYLGKHSAWLLTAAVVILLSCQHHTPNYPRELLLADSLAYVHPDSSIALLESLEKRMASEPEAIKMYYELLRIKAADKAYILHKTDSLIIPIVDYYEKTEDQERLSEAYYYAGRIYRDLGDAPRAISYLLKSKETESEKINPAIYAQIGEIYFDQSLYPEALQMYSEAYRLDSIVNDTIGMILDLRDIAFAHRMQHHTEITQKTLLQAERLALLSDDKEMISLVSSQLAGFYSRNGKEEEALKQIEKALPDAGGADRFSIYDTYANILLRRGDTEGARTYFEQMLQSDDLQIQVDAYSGLTQLAGLEHRAEEGLRYFNKYRLLSDSLSRMAAAESVNRMNALYNYQQYKQEAADLKIQNQRKQMLIIGLICASIVLLTLIIAYFSIRRIQMKHRLEKVQGLLREHLEKQVKQEELAQKEDAIMNSPIAKRLQACIEDDKPMTEADVSDIESLFGEVIPSFLPLLRQLADMSPLEYQVSLLLRMNISPIHIASLVLRHKSTISAIRRSLYKRTTGKDGSPADWDNIIHSLGI